MPTRTVKYRIEFKVKAIGGALVNLVCHCRNMRDAKRKIGIFKAQGMPWAFDFKLFEGADGPFIRDL